MDSIKLSIMKINEVVNSTIEEMVTADSTVNSKRLNANLINETIREYRVLSESVSYLPDEEDKEILDYADAIITCIDVETDDSILSNKNRGVESF